MHRSHEITAAHSGYTEALWRLAVAPMLEAYHPGRVLNSQHFVEAFCPYLPQRAVSHTTAQPLQAEGIDFAAQLCFSANVGITASASSTSGAPRWFYGALLPRIVEWAKEFPTLFPVTDLTVRAQPRNDTEELQWLEEGGGIPLVSIPVYALPLLSVVAREHGETEATETAVLTRRQCRSVLALSFLGIEPRQFSGTVQRPYASGEPSPSYLSADADTDVCDVGSISWYLLYRSRGTGVGDQRLACMLQYFETWRAAEASEALVDHLPDLASLDDKVVFVRSANCPTSQPPDFSVDFTVFEPAAVPGAPTPSVIVDTRFMEAFEEAEAHVDFANMQIHIGRIIPSCTQEEVMFSIRPELFLALPLYTTLRDNEAAVVKGAACFAAYTGYAKTFSYAGPCNAPRHPLSAASRTIAATSPVAQRRLITDVIIIDAHVNQGAQFGAAMHARDVRKAYRGFQISDALLIGTGPWGCGVFAGDLTLKFLQQAIAARLCTPPRRLHYHAMQAPFYTALAAAMAATNVTVGTAHHWVLEFDAMRRGVRGRSTPYDYDKVRRSYEADEWPSLDEVEEGEASSVVLRRAAALAGWKALHREAANGVTISPFTEFIVCKVADLVLKSLKS